MEIMAIAQIKTIMNNIYMIMIHNILTIYIILVDNINQMTTKMIVCSNKKSINYKGLNQRSKDNARWSNNVNVDLTVGDQISVSNGILNIRGASSNETIEISAESDNTTGLVDSRMGIRFSAYVNDNARNNTVALPFTGGNERVEYPLTYKLDVYPAIGVLDGITFIPPEVSKTNVDNYTAPFNANEPVTSDSFFQFSYDYDDSATRICTPYSQNVKTLYTESGSKRFTFGHRYTVMDENYLGPYRKNDTGDFWSGEEDCKAMNFDVKIDVGQIYASPSTLANEIDDQLNASNVYGENELDPLVYDSHSQPTLLPSLTGSLLKNKKVNGVADDPDATANGKRKSLYGNFAVKNLSDWKALHKMMRMDIAFDYEMSFNSSTQMYKQYRPTYLMPRCFMRLNDEQTPNSEYCFYPRIRVDYNVNFAHWNGLGGGGTGDHDVPFYFSVLPENFLMCTNISYTEDNIKRFADYQKLKEKYDGLYADDTDDQEKDIKNYRMQMDVGTSMQGTADKANATYMNAISQGNVDISGKAVKLTDGNPTMYAYSYPYYPFDPDTTLPNFNNAFATNRSDLVDVGYTQLSVFNLETINVVHMETTSPNKVRFKNNKNKDASMAVFSRYDKDWKTKARTDNLSDNITMESGYRGNGTYDLDGFSTDNDDSLSKKYNVAVYPVTIRNNKAPPKLIDLTDTCWIGYAGNVPENAKFFFPNPDQKYIFKIGIGHDQDHLDHGGYSMYTWNQFPGNWEVYPDTYIYSHQNQSLADGRDAVNGVKFDGEDVIDLNNESNVFVVDCGNTKRFVMAFWDIDVPQNMNIYFCEGYSDNAGPDYDNLNDYNPLGQVPMEINGWFEIYLTNAYSASSDPSNKYYIEPVFGIPVPVSGNLPVITDNPEASEQIVCAYALYRDSGTQNSDGTWTLSEDFALPALYNGMVCASASFLDHEAVWLLNSGRYDTDSSKTMTEETQTDFLSIGCNSISFTFENSVSKCAFSNMHNVRKLGVTDMPIDAEGDIDMTNIGREVVKINDDKVNRTWLYDMITSFDSGAGTFGELPNAGDNQFNAGLNYATGGVSIESIYGESETESFQSLDDMTEYTIDNWNGSLLYKLGFAFRDLIPKWGRPDRLYDSSKVNNPNPDYRYDRLKPISTNPLVDISGGSSLPVQDGRRTDKVGMGEPLYDLAVGTKQSVNLDGSVSEFVYASGLPIKQNDGFFFIYSNLSDGSYIQNESKYSIIGTIVRNYESGDYVYGFENPPITVPFSGKMTQIDIEIRGADGRVVSLDDDNTIIFKLLKTGSLQLDPPPPPPPEKGKSKKKI